MNEESKTISSADLTANEVSHVWSAYLKNSLEISLYQYFYTAVESPDFKEIIKEMLDLSTKNIDELKNIIVNAGLTVPLAFNQSDTDLNAPKFISDTFMIHFCYDLTQLSLHTYPSALPDCTRQDVRSFFQRNVEAAMNIQNEIVTMMLSMGIFVKPPLLALKKEREFVESKAYLSDLFSGHRSLNVAEIANLSRIILRAQFSKMVFVAFAKNAQSKKARKFFSKGRDTLDDVLNSLQGILEKDNIPVPSSGDFTIYEADTPPFSDKLMMFFVSTCLGMLCFLMLTQAMNSCLRTDILSTLMVISTKFRKFYAEGLFISIEENWLEEPPQAVNRKI
ncbi:DUF3231 family protein [Bacillus sp. AK031]